MLIAGRLHAVRASLATIPSRKDLLQSFIPIGLYITSALVIGFTTDFLRIEFLHTDIHRYLILPFSMMIIPSFLEELAFRAFLLPHPSKPTGKFATRLACFASITLYVVWHPFYAAVSGVGIPIFDPPFLGIVLILGITCTWLYIRTGSVWLPTFIHWLTVTVWVFFMGGRNIIVV